ncbi:MAG: acyl-protein synthetase [Deltaproteobacteria bacterium]|jgi:hypothetical protein|nr:acyl-protein synthetase [Deltaproteobacteria bacterium]MBW2531334.1 acyl-protein synthetase [Deltaproteobacteria bacterium]
MNAPPATRASDDLHARVQRFIRTVDLERPTPASLAEREEIAIEVARFQAAEVEALATLWQARGGTDASLRSWTEIPALSCDVFRARRVAAHPADADVRRFRTTGTTRGAEARGEHPLRTTRTYQAAALLWGEHMLWPDRGVLEFIGLVPPEEEAPDSSLSFMLACFAKILRGSTSWHVHGGALDIDSVARACSEARKRGLAALVAGTSLAFAELCDELDRASLALPAGSRIMHTGGFKGRDRAIDADSLRKLIAALFRVPPSHVVGEYGMTELSSQLYEGSLRRALGLGLPAAQPGCFYPPPWMQVRTLAPETLEETPAGEPGLCELLDLANVDSAVRILTADLAATRPDGAVELRGRAAGAPARGCSLGID